MPLPNTTPEPIDFVSPEKHYAAMMQKLPAAMMQYMNLDGTKRSFIVDKVWVGDGKFSGVDLDDIQEARQTKTTLSAPIYASITLIDKATQQPLDRNEKVRIGSIPVLTRQGSFVVNGNGYNVLNQLRLRSGVYTFGKQNGELVTMFNLKKGKNIELSYDRDKGGIAMRVGTAEVAVLPVLEALGMHPDTMRKAFGDEFYASNVKAAGDPQKAVIRAAEMLTGVKADYNTAAANLREYFNNTQTDAANNQRLLGIATDVVTPELMTAAAVKHMDVYRGDKEPDDRDSLLFKTAHTMDDLLLSRFAHWKNKSEYDRKIASRIDRFNTVKEVLGSTDASAPIHKFFMSSADGGAGLITLNDETSPVEARSKLGQITMMGEGGISSEHAVPLSTRALHPSHAGAIDGIFTPEANKVGLTLHATEGAVKIGDQIGYRLYDPAAKAFTHKAVTELDGKIIALPDHVVNNPDGTQRLKDVEIRAVRDGVVGYYPAGKADYYIPSSHAGYSTTSNLIPMVGSISGNRAMFGVKMIEQAVPLKHPDLPMVRPTSEVGSPWASTIENPAVGGARVADVDGVVDAVEPNRIWVRSTDGTRVKHGIFNNFPGQSGSLFHHTPAVKVGDAVTKGQVIADSQSTRGGVFMPGKNLTTAVMALRGVTTEDALAVSESAAKKLTSVHMSVKEFPIGDESAMGLKKYRAAFPGTVPDIHAARMDDDGVVREGTKIGPGEHVILGMRRRQPRPEDALVAKLSRKLYKPYLDSAVTWDNDNEGEVVRVVKGRDAIRVYIRTEEPFELGDKMVGYADGGKGIAVVLPDSEMPRRADGSAIDVVVNPHSIYGRNNPATILAMGANMVAEKTGQPYYVKSHHDGSNVDEIYGKMKELGLGDGEEDLTDPVTGKTIPKVFVAPKHWMKLKHQVSGKYSARDRGAYDVDGQPLRGGDEGAKRTDALQNYAILAHGGSDVLQDISLNKSDRNDEMWRSVKLGLPMPPLRTTFATDKFLSLLKGAGINTVKTGTRIKLLPMTDKDTLAISNGEIKSARMLRAEDMREEPGGLYSPEVLGGLNGKRYGHFTLHEPVPNPVMEEAIMAVTGLTNSDIQGLVAAKLSLGSDGKTVPYDAALPTGGLAIKSLLDGVDAVKEFEATKQQLTTTKNNASINKLNKRGRYLRALVQNGMTASDAYMMNHVPVVPPAVRPTYELPNGSINVSSLSSLYRDLFLVNEKIGAFSALPKHHTQDLREDLYNSIKAIQGLGDPISNREYKGIISTIRGTDSPKHGYAQSRLIARPMDSVGRSTIVPDPDLSPDEIGIPEEMAWKVYAPYAVAELVKSGVPPLTASEKVEARDPMASKALDIAMQGRPALMNRAPSLHKFSVMGFTPHRVPGKALHIPPLVFKGFNADVDGDSILGDILIRDTDGCPRIVDIAEFGSSFEKAPRAMLSRDERRGKRGVVKLAKGRFKAAVVPAGVASDWGDITYFSVHKKLQMFDVEVSGIPKPVRASADASLCVVNEGADGAFHAAATPSEALGKLAPVMWSIDCSGSEREHDEFGFDDGVALGAQMWLNRGDFYKGAWRHNSAFIAAATQRLSCVKSAPWDAATQRMAFKKPGLESELVKTDPRILYYDLPKRGKEFRTGFLYGVMNGAAITRDLIRSENHKSMRTACKVIRDAAEILRYIGMYCGHDVRATQGRREWMWISVDRVTRWAFQAIEAETARVGAVAITLMDKVDSFEIEDSVYFIPRRYCQRKGQRWLPLSQKGLLRDYVKCAELADAHHMRWLVKRLNLQFGRHWINITRIGLFDALRIVLEAQKREALRDHAFISALMQTLSRPVSYELVSSVRVVPGLRTAYDLTVPGVDVFCTGSGVSVKNTMMLSVPVSRAAVNQVHDMKPSRHLINPGTGDLMIIPKAESIQGTFVKTRPGKKTNMKFETADAVLEAEKAGTISETDMVELGGVSTNAGRIKMNALIPEQFRDYDRTWDNKHVKDTMMRIVKEAPDSYIEAVRAIKREGDEAAYLSGMTLGIKDLVPVRHIRDKVYNNAMAQWKMGGGKPDDLVRRMKSANDEVEMLLDSHYAKHPNPIWDSVKSGALGKKTQALQMINAPVLVNDHAGKTIQVPVLRSYSEGLNFGDYLITMYGQRKGMIDRALSTAEPGEIQKETLVAAAAHSVSEHDCGAAGIDEDITDRSVINRVAGADIALDGHVVVKRGDRITPMAVTTLKRAGVKSVNVRSALTCESEHGVCQIDVGFNERNELPNIGFNIGALSASTITEPLTQGVMKNFHQGGTTFGKTISGLDRIRQLVEIPRIMANSGAISRVDGVVDSIEQLPSGDRRVIVGGEPHFVNPGLELKVAKGQKLSKGDDISTGVKHPRDVLETQGLLAARRFLTNELQNTYKNDNGLDMDKRHFEIIAKTVSNYAHIDDPGDAETVLRGDLMPLAKVERYNKLAVAAGRAPMQYSPQLRGVVQAAITSDDWLARMGARQLKKTLIDGVSSGMESDVGPTSHPMARYIYGVHMTDDARRTGQATNINGLKLSDLDFSAPIIEHGKKNAKPVAKASKVAPASDIPPK